ncbi:MAG: hypothetical protein CME16_03000 [Gemmatimonadetes bacterium]|nr:hypothetical protein [Gemmatimonadota bacterium]
MRNKFGSFTIIATFFSLVIATGEPAEADLSAFVATVGFDEEANLNRGSGFGVRWGKSSGIIGGETALMIAFPERELGGLTEMSGETATALFYEGRLLVNIPMGQISPFVGIGFGQIYLTSTDVPSDVTQTDTVKLLKDVSGAQTSNALSYGGGIRYGLNKRLDLRADLRQYLVFSVAGLVKARVADEVGEEVGDIVELPEVDDGTVRYNELSVGVNIRF